MAKAKTVKIFKGKCPNCGKVVVQKDLFKDIVRKVYYCIKCQTSYREEFPVGK